MMRSGRLAVVTCTLLLLTHWTEGIGYVDIPELANCASNLVSNYGTTIDRYEYGSELILAACARTYTEDMDADKLESCLAGENLDFDDLPSAVRENYCNEACGAGKNSNFVHMYAPQ